jgi:hypothetical protein
VDPADPVAPVEPVAPVKPVDPIGPLAPVAPVLPVSPVGPIGPVDPVILGPVAPVTPVAPVWPSMGPLKEDALMVPETNRLSVISADPFTVKRISLDGTERDSLTPVPLITKEPSTHKLQKCGVLGGHELKRLFKNKKDKQKIRPTFCVITRYPF